MIDRSKLWTLTGALYAIAAAIVVLALATGNSIFQHRYQFAASSLDGHAVWRGDMITGQAVLCGTDVLVDGLQARDPNENLVRKCH